MNDYRYGFNDGKQEQFRFEKGLDEKLIRQLSLRKNEPKRILDFRLNAYKKFLSLKNPKYGPKLKIDFNEIFYYINPSNQKSDKWDKIDSNIKSTFNKLGVIDAEKHHLAGLATQYESEVVYHNLELELKQQGVIFTDMETAINNHFSLFLEYFATLVKSDDNKYAALNSAVFSGGTFIYIPKNVKLKKPLHSYFRMNADKMGQFERTLIIVDENAELSYIEGCTAPTYSNNSLHAAVVEIFVKKNAKCRYTALQNWSNNVYNLVTKRAICEESAIMEWIDGNIGAKINMKYPAVILKGDNSKAKMISVALANKNQNQDTGAKMIHLGKNTSSHIISKSIVQNGGISTYRGLIFHDQNALNAKSSIECDTLILDKKSISNTIPLNIIKNGSSQIEHEAKISTLSEELLYYMMSRGLKKEVASELIIGGFIETFTKELPMEYAIEFNNLLKNEMEGSIG